MFFPGLLNVRPDFSEYINRSLHVRNVRVGAHVLWMHVFTYTSVRLPVFSCVYSRTGVWKFPLLIVCFYLHN